MASSKPVQCGPCKQESLKSTADIWCYNCDEGLCSTCSGHHKKFRSTRDHKTIDIQTYKSYKLSIGSIKTECDIHSQQFNLYCPSHLMPCCDDCISTHHSKCTDIESLESVVEKAKIEQSKVFVEKEITSILLSLNAMANKKTSNIKKGEQQCESIKESISKIREEINRYLDHLEKKLYKDADTIWDQEKSKLKGLINKIEEKKKNIKAVQDDLHTITVNRSRLKSYLGLHEIEQKVHQCRYAVDIENEEVASEVDIEIEQTYEIEKILNELKSLKSFGEVKVVKSKVATNRETSVRREAQIELRENSNIHNITMNIEKKMKINIEWDIIDMICLMDGKVIVVNRWGTVYLLTSDGKVEKQLPITSEAFSVTQINQDNIAITYPSKKVINIFSMKNETVTKVITLGKYCYGLSFFNNSLAVGLNNNEIRIIDLEGNTLKSIQVESKSCLNNLVYCYDRVIYSDYRGKAVYCVDESGNQIWQYTQDLQGPEGHCFDTYGNFIVTDYQHVQSNRIIVISKDGQDKKELIHKEDGLKDPIFICLSYNKTSGFICDTRGRYWAKFNLSYK